MGQYSSQTKVIRVKPSQKPKTLPAPLTPFVALDNTGYLQTPPPEDPNNPPVVLGNWRQTGDAVPPRGNFVLAPSYKSQPFLPYQQPNSSQGVSAESVSSYDGSPSADMLAQVIRERGNVGAGQGALLRRTAELAKPLTPNPTISQSVGVNSGLPLQESLFFARQGIRPPPNQFDMLNVDTQGQLAGATALQHGLQQPLPPLPFRPYSPAPLPQRQQIAAPNLPRFDGDPLAQGLAALGGFLAPEAAGQFNAAPLLAGVKQAQENYGYQHQQYQDLQGQANQQYEDALRGWQAQDAATQFNLREQAQNDKIQYEQSIRRGEQLVHAGADVAGLSTKAVLAAPLADRQAAFDKANNDLNSYGLYLQGISEERTREMQAIKMEMDALQKEADSLRQLMVPLINQTGQDYRQTQKISAEQQAAAQKRVDQLNYLQARLAGEAANKKAELSIVQQNAIAREERQFKLNTVKDWIEKFKITPQEAAAWNKDWIIPQSVYTAVDPKQRHEAIQIAKQGLQTRMKMWDDAWQTARKNLNELMVSPLKDVEKNKQAVAEFEAQLKDATEGYNKVFSAYKKLTAPEKEQGSGLNGVLPPPQRAPKPGNAGKKPVAPGKTVIRQTFDPLTRTYR